MLTYVITYLERKSSYDQFNILLIGTRAKDISEALYLFQSTIPPVISPSILNSAYNITGKVQ